MSVEVFPHETFDGLLAAAGDAMRAVGPVPQPVVAPSLSFTDHLKRRLAERYGVCMGLNFLMPRDFIHLAVGPGAGSPWGRNSLPWKILPHVTECAARLGLEVKSLRDRFALADQLADRLDQYAHFRPDFLRIWADGGMALSRENSHEAWQRELWLKLREDIGQPHPAEETATRFRDPKFSSALAAKFPKLLVLGSGSIDPLLIEVLEILAHGGADVRVDVVLPSLGYLADLQSRRASLPREDEDIEEWALSNPHPLLESMGRHAVGSFVLLGRLDEQYTHWPAPSLRQQPAGHLLARLQDDIRSVRSPVAAQVDEKDLSLRIHSCFGPRREMEVLCDEILRAYRDFPGLKPEDILIVTPSPETYAPLVAAVLELSGIPVRLTEVPGTAADPVLEGLGELLQMAFSGQHTASRLLEFLQVRSVQAALGIAGGEDQLEQVRLWIGRSGLTEGLGDESTPEVGTWRFARDRMLAGRWFGPQETGKYPSGRFLLPIADDLGAGEDLLGRFLSWLARLEKTLRDWEAEVPPGVWADRLEAASRELLCPTDGLASPEARTVFSFLRGLDCEVALDAGALWDWLRGWSEPLSRRTVVSGRTTFGRFNQIQNLPCRILAMVGMEDGAFPGRGSSPAWDLLRAAPRVWDRNPRVDDRQLFLDAVLAPSDRLIVTAPNRNMRNGKDEPFSTCVDELLRVALLMGAQRSELVVRHSLQPFAAEYFCNGEKNPPRSFSETHVRTASALAAGSKRRGIPLFAGEDEEPVVCRVGEIALAELVGFWKDPAKASLKARGIRVPDEAEDEFAWDRQPLKLGGLEAWSVKDGILSAFLDGGESPDHQQALLEANRELPPGFLGARAWGECRDLVGPLGSKIKDLVGEPIEVSADSGVPEIRLTGQVLLTRDKSQTLAYRVGKFGKASHFLEPWIQALAVSASGLALPMLLLGEDRFENVEPFPAIPLEEAQHLIKVLVEGFLLGQSSLLTFAPDTSDTLAEVLDSGEESEAITKAAAKWDEESEGRAACLAWRDRDPFADPAPWVCWARKVASPLARWGKFR